MPCLKRQKLSRLIFKRIPLKGDRVVRKLVLCGFVTSLLCLPLSSVFVRLGTYVPLSPAPFRRIRDNAVFTPVSTSLYTDE